MLVRALMILSFVSMATLITGCCCGPGGGGACITNCADCDGGGCGGPGIVYGPLQHMTQLRKSIVCGGGCGEVYRGEWTSTPPDACDPCQEGQFVGGAVPCFPFCFRPGYFFGFFTGLYGQRFCDGCGNNVTHCGCGSGFIGDDSCGCSAAAGGAGCATCNSGHAQDDPHRVASPPKVDTQHRTARARALRRGVSSNYSKRPTQYR